MKFIFLELFIQKSIIVLLGTNTTVKSFSAAAFTIPITTFNQHFIGRKEQSSSLSLRQCHPRSYQSHPILRAQVPSLTSSSSLYFFRNKEEERSCNDTTTTTTIPSRNQQPPQQKQQPPNNNEQQLQEYNDDAFGLVFLIGGLAFQNIDFAIFFLVLSACAAIGTSRGIWKVDDRIPGFVALFSLVFSTMAVWLRTTMLLLEEGNDSSGSINMMLDMIPNYKAEIGVCLISLATGFYKWNKKNNQ